MISKLTGYIRRHHVGLIALAVAMTGTAYAANKVGPRQIKPNAVRSHHIKDGQVRALDVGPTFKVTRTVDVPAAPGDGTFRGVVVICPRRTRPVGMDVGWDFAPALASIRSVKIDRFAVFAAGAHSGDDPARLRVTAHCLRK